MSNKYRSEIEKLLVIIREQWPQAYDYAFPDLNPDRAESFVWLPNTYYQLLHLTVSPLTGVFIKPFTIKKENDFNEMVRILNYDDFVQSKITDYKLGTYCLYTGDSIYIDNIGDFNLNNKEKHDISKLKEVVESSFDQHVNVQ